MLGYGSLTSTKNCDLIEKFLFVDTAVRLKGLAPLASRAAYEIP